MPEEARTGLRLRAWIYCGDQVAMGPKMADLLQAIENEGSISGAARALEISYRHAWLMVSSMNRCWRAPLVSTMTGAGPRSGARLTEQGRTVLAHYRALQDFLGQAGTAKVYAVLEDCLRAEPLPEHRRSSS